MVRRLIASLFMWAQLPYAHTATMGITRTGVHLMDTMVLAGFRVASSSEQAHGSAAGSTAGGAFTADAGSLAVAEASWDAAPLVDSAAARHAVEAVFMAVAERAVVADTGKFRRQPKGINGRQIKLPAVFFV